MGPKLLKRPRDKRSDQFERVNGNPHPSSSDEEGGFNIHSSLLRALGLEASLKNAVISFEC
jgi:hypothetical protein